MNADKHGCEGNGMARSDTKPRICFICDGVLEPLTPEEEIASELAQGSRKILDLCEDDLLAYMTGDTRVVGLVQDEIDRMGGKN